MIRSSGTAIACLLALMGGPDTGVSQTIDPAIRVKRAEIIDSKGFERPLVAATIFVPAAWQTTGGVAWGNDPCGKGYNFDWRATAPDGASGIHVFPMEQWHWNSWASPHPMGCPAVQITTVRDYLEGFVRRARPGAIVLDFRRRADIEGELQQLNRTTPMTMGQIQSWVEAGEVLIAYAQNGVDMRETLASAAVFSVIRIEPMTGVPGAEYWSGATLPGYAVHAPNGQLDFRMAEMIRKSIRSGPAWSARIAQHEAKIASIQIKGARDRSRMIAQTGEEIRQMQTDSWRLYNESSDYLSRERSEAIRGVETYDDPYYGDTVQLDNTYEHAWQLDDGSYVLTDDPSFAPYPIFGMDGQQLNVTQ